MGPFIRDDSSSMTVDTWIPLGPGEHLVIPKQIERLPAIM